MVSQSRSSAGKILRELIDNEVVSVHRLIDQLYGQDPDGGPLTADNIVHLNIFRIRKCLWPGWQIKNLYSQYALVYIEPTEQRLAA